MTNLTTQDLRDTLESAEHLGWGYACCDDLDSTTRHNVDVVVIRLANAARWTAAELFEWSNSKYGRYLSDHLHGERWSQKALLADAGVRSLITLKGLELPGRES